MPETLEEKKARLEMLYEEFKLHAARIQEIAGDVPRLTNPLLAQHGVEGGQVAIEMLGKFAQICEGIGKYLALGSRSTPAN